MITTKNYVIDTTALISFFSGVFNIKPAISDAALKVIESAFTRGNVRLTIPSIVFVEIFEKWYKTDEMSYKIFYEIYKPIIEAENMEIREIDREVVENFISIDDRIVNMENHDKIVLASAMTLKSTLITNDPNIIRYVRRTTVIPSVLS